MAKMSGNVLEKAFRFLRGLMKEAKEYLKDKEKLSHLLGEALALANAGRKNLSSVWDDLKLLVRLVKAWKDRQYRRIPTRSVAAILAAILYLVNPMDIIPDFLPGVGYLDDATVLAWVMKMIADDIEEFRQWEAGSESS